MLMNPRALRILAWVFISGFAIAALLPFAFAAARLRAGAYVYAAAYWKVGRPSFEQARSAVNAAISKAPDGPWEYARSRFVLTHDFKSGEPKPTWVFRYRNTKSGVESVRIFVRIPEFTTYTTAIGLDELPAYGFLPP